MNATSRDMCVLTLKKKKKVMDSVLAIPNQFHSRNSRNSFGGIQTPSEFCWNGNKIWLVPLPNFILGIPGILGFQ